MSSSTRGAATSRSPTRSTVTGLAIWSSCTVVRATSRSSARPRSCGHFTIACSAFSRFIVFDKRGTGLSDRLRKPRRWRRGWTTSAPCSTPRLRACGSLWFGRGRLDVHALRSHLSGPSPRAGARQPVGTGTWAPDYPWARDHPRSARARSTRRFSTWGTYAAAERMVRYVAPSHADDPEFIAALARHLRLSASPGAIATLMRMAADTDVRDVLGAIRVPTLICTSRTIARRPPMSPSASRVPAWSSFPVRCCHLPPGSTLLPEVQRFVADLGAVAAGHRPRDGPLHRHCRLDGEARRTG